MTTLVGGKTKTSTILTSCLLCIFFAKSSLAQTPVLKVSIPTAIANTLPGFNERIQNALSRTGIDFEIEVNPTVRSMELVKLGKVAIEFARVPFAMAKLPDVERLEPPVSSLTFKMLTSNQTPEFCSAEESDYASMSMGGLRGVRLHELYFYPKFGSNYTINDAISLFKFMYLRRADVSFLPQTVFDAVDEETKKGLIICDKSSKTFHFYGHLHKDFIWAKEALEEGLATEFGN